MVKISLSAAGLAFALVATVSAPAQGGPAGLACEVIVSNVVEGEEIDERSHRAHDTIDAAIGAGKAKERIADQLRRGLIGTVFDPATGTVTAVMTPEFGPPDRLKADNVRAVTGCHSASELIEAEDVLIGRSWHPDASRAAYGFSLHGTDSRFHVSFDSRYPQAAEVLKARLGDWVVVTLGAAGRSGRLDDGRPHFGGAGLREGYGSAGSNWCTSGFSVRRNASDGQYGSITAGHCFNEGASIYSGPKYYGYSWGKWNYPHHDILGIRSGTETYDNVIHVDPCCPATRTVIGRHFARVGDYVCFSGMTTRAICSIRVQSTGGVFCDPAGCTGGLIEAVRNNEVFARSGDSGGPIYVRTGSSSALAAGMIVAGAGGGTLAYGEMIHVIESHLNVTLMTT